MFIHLSQDLQIYIINEYLIINDLIKLDISYCNKNRIYLLNLYSKINITSGDQFNIMMKKYSLDSILRINLINNIYCTMNKWLIDRNIKFNTVYIYPEIIADYICLDNNKIRCISKSNIIWSYILSKPNMINNINICDIADFTINNNIINIVILNNINLHSVNLINISEFVFDTVINNCVNIINFSIKFCYSDNTHEIKLLRIINKYKNLKKCNIGCCKISQNINIFEKLINLHHLKIFSSGLNIILPSSLITLKLYIIHGNNNIINLSKCTNLTILIIESCEINALDLSNCVNLITVKIIKCNLKIIHISNALLKLPCIVINQCLPKIVTKFITKFKDVYQKLQILFSNTDIDSKYLFLSEYMSIYDYHNNACSYGSIYPFRSIRINN